MMNMGDEEVLAALIDAPWERLKLQEIGELAVALLQAGILDHVAQVIMDHRTLDEEISDAFDEVTYEKTVRINTNWKD